MEKLTKVTPEPLMGGAGLYSNAFMVLSTLVALCPILSLMQFNCFKHMPSFKMPTIIQVWHHIWQGDGTFSSDVKGAYLHIPIVKHHHHWLWIVW